MSDETIDVPADHPIPAAFMLEARVILADLSAPTATTLAASNLPMLDDFAGWMGAYLDFTRGDAGEPGEVLCNLNAEDAARTFVELLHYIVDVVTWHDITDETTKEQAIQDNAQRHLERMQMDVTPREDDNDG